VGLYNQEKEVVMARIIQCECGFVARGQTDAEVIDAIRGHLGTDHPALLATVDQADLLGWIKVE
jgi:predicted small metal-binding protein